MKKMITMFAATIVAVSAALTPAFGTTYAGVEFNGEKVQFEQDPVIENGRVLVPFRFVAEKLGATVAWDAETSSELVLVILFLHFAIILFSKELTLDKLSVTWIYNDVFCEVKNFFKSFL